MSELKDLRQTNKYLRDIIRQKEIEYDKLLEKLLRLESQVKAYEAIISESQLKRQNS